MNGRGRSESRLIGVGHDGVAVVGGGLGEMDSDSVEYEVVGCWLGEMDGEGGGSEVIGEIEGGADRVMTPSGAQEPWVSEAVWGAGSIGCVEAWVWTAGRVRTPSGG